jgi:hypothetical protein
MKPKASLRCDIWEYYTVDIEDSGFLGCYNDSRGSWFPVFWVKFHFWLLGSWTPQPLKMEAVHCFETLGINNSGKQCNNSEIRIVHYSVQNLFEVLIMIQSRNYNNSFPLVYSQVDKSKDSLPSYPFRSVHPQLAEIWLTHFSVKFSEISMLTTASDHRQKWFNTLCGGILCNKETCHMTVYHCLT